MYLSFWLLTIAFGAWSTTVNAQTSGDWTDLLTYIQNECAQDTTEVDEACAWLPAVEACSAGDSLACDSIWATWSGYLTDAVDDSDSTSNDVSDAIDTILGELQAECDADTSGTALECDLIPLATACLGGDSLACIEWGSAWLAFENSSDDSNGDGDPSGTDDSSDSDDSDDAFDTDSIDDDSDDWASILVDLQSDCAEDTTGLDAACDLALTLEACLGGDSLACADWESDWMTYSDDDSDNYGDEEWENEGGSLESILAYLQADCAEDTTGLDESCALAAIAESCLAGDSLACVDWDAAWMAYDSDDDDEDDDDEDDDNDSDDDGLSDDDEILYSTDANLADTDGDGLIDGDEVLLFNLSPTSTDTDGNGIPDPVDLVYSMLPQVNACPSDINRDGTVSIGDMLLFLVDFGTNCPE